MTSLPPLPENVGAQAPQSSPLSGGMPSFMQFVQQIEDGYKKLALALPSLAPIAAEGISKLRMAVPSAMDAGAGAQAPTSPAITGSGYLPSPPQGQ